MKFLYKIKKLLLIKDYYYIALLFIFSVISMFMEIFSISILIPLFANLNNSFSFENELLSKIIEIFNFDLFNDLKYLSILIILIFLIKNIIYLTARFVEAKFCYNFYSNLSKKLFSYYLYKNYIFHINKNSATLIRNISLECNLLSFQFLQPLISSISEFLSLLIILIFLYILNPIATISILGFLIFVALIFNIMSKSYLVKLGKQRQVHSGLALKELQQSFSNIREIIIYKAQQYFVKKYNFHNSTNANTGFRSKFIFSLPRSILEISVITAVMMLIFVLIKTSLSFAEIILIISIYILSASRMLPAITKIFSNFTTFNYTQKVLSVINNEFLSYLKKKKNFNNSTIQFKKIKLNNISFRYPSSKQDAINKINLEINNNDKIGILGPSGSGKTTLINIFCGLIKNYKGKILVDDKDLNLNIERWQNNIGYVPQNSLTIDENLEENIRIGRSKIKRNKLKKILKTVDLESLNKRVESNKYKSIGERGSKISGGQNQRVGIARALYNEPSILILDETLSAIDKKTRVKILKKVFNLYKDKLIIIISHSRKDLNLCNKIFSIDNGRLKSTK